MTAIPRVPIVVTILLVLGAAVYFSRRAEIPRPLGPAISDVKVGALRVCSWGVTARGGSAEAVKGDIQRFVQEQAGAGKSQLILLQSTPDLKTIEAVVEGVGAGWTFKAAPCRADGGSFLATLVHPVLTVRSSALIDAPCGVQALAVHVETPQGRRVWLINVDSRCAEAKEYEALAHRLRTWCSGRERGLIVVGGRLPDAGPETSEEARPSAESRAAGGAARILAEGFADPAPSRDAASPAEGQWAAQRVLLWPKDFPLERVQVTRRRGATDGADIVALDVSLD